MEEAKQINWDRHPREIDLTVHKSLRSLALPFTYHAWIADKEEGWHDGDTPYIFMQTDPDHWWGAPHKPVRSRIAALQAPELTVDKLPNPAGLIARDYARGLLPVGSEVFVTVAARDMYGRPLVVMKFLTGESFSGRMIMAGHGEVYRYLSQE